MKRSCSGKALYVLVRPVVVVLNSLDTQRCILALSPGQSPVWRNLDLEHEPMVACDHNQEVVYGRLFLDAHVNMIELHHRPFWNAGGG